MGYTVTTVCAVAAYTYPYTLYGFGLGDFTFTGIVANGNCSFTLADFDNDAGSYVEVVNITSPGQSQFEPISCNITSSLGCNTNYYVFPGPGTFSSNTFDFLTVNTTGTYNADNFTYYLLPPVPSQPIEATLINNNNTVSFSTSTYSQEYGFPLIGCVVAAGPTVWLPSTALPTLPTKLSSTASQNCLPYTSSAVYTSSQNASMTVSLQAMNLKPSTAYDFWVLCYNSQGMSAQSILFNQMSPASLPQPTAANNTNCPNGNNNNNNGASSISGKAGWLAAALAAAAGVAMVA